ncbi:MAG: thermonuclease family protein [Alphaproteobacteria bacterium]
MIQSRLVIAWCAGFFLAALFAAAAGAVAGEVLPGPVPARLVRVVDGDTVIVRARIWLGQEVEISVRLHGIDAPEIQSRCPRERELAKRAGDFVRGRLGGRGIQLSAIQYGKYAGRVVARLAAEDGEDISSALLAAGLAKSYDGGRRKAWCDQATR